MKIGIDDWTQDRRLQRAETLTAEIMRAIDPIIRSPDVNTGHVAREILSLLYDKGVEAFTDFDRRTLGLPPRNGKVWTAHELAILEQKRIEAMMKPIRYYGANATGRNPQ